MPPSLPDLQKKGFPCTPSRKKNLLKFKRGSTRSAWRIAQSIARLHGGKVGNIEPAGTGNASDSSGAGVGITLKTKMTKM
jgi:hypothetical protein